MRRIEFFGFLFLFGFNILVLSLNFSIAQETKKIGGFTFTTIKELKATPIKNQNNSGTCWDFSGTSFVESELIRMGKGEYDLSEMFNVRNAYVDKAEQYVRWHGSTSFSAGGEFHDVMNVIRDKGLVPKEVYPGLLEGDKLPFHYEMDGVLKAILDELIKNPNGKLSPVWHKVIEDVLDDYLGKYPEKFTYQGKSYTPKSFAKELGFNPDDYIEITSFTHHPFYEQFILEVPDNWALAKEYNVPLNDFARIIDYSIMNGYTVLWGSDVSDEGYSFKNGVAIVPVKEWSDIDKKEKDTIFNHPVPQRIITQEMRQKAFDNYSTTDDHGMHILGIVKDQTDQKYYKVKNSWGVKKSDYEGYLYASESFILLESTSIMVNKNAIPKDIAKKMGIN